MPQQLGRYRIEELLGEGSFAWVYRAIDVGLERPVALKVLKPAWLSDPQALARFKQEARTMARLHHPHIVVIHEVGEAEGQVFLAQFLVEGETLAAKLKRDGALPWPETLHILRQVALALDYAHQQGLVHRDIKPANILLGQNGQAYLSDFGLVRAAEGSVALSTSAGGMIGTPAYMAPELWEGKPSTAATDVYALSCVVLEMLTGRVLFDGSTPAVVMRQHLIQGPQFPERWPVGVPGGVTEVLQQGLAENPVERLGSAGELVAALAALSAPIPDPTTQSTPKLVKPETPSSPPPIPAKATLPVTAPVSKSVAWGGWTANKSLLMGGGVALLVIIGAIIFFAFRGGRGGEPTAVAVNEAATPTATPEPDTSPFTPVSAPTDIPTPTLTNTPRPTPTVIPTNTPIPATDTPTSTDTPSPTPTPEGGTIAYSCSNNNICLADLSGSVIRIFELGEGYGPNWMNWSPDGSYLLFGINLAGLNEFDSSELFTLDIRTGDLLQLTDNFSGDMFPTWSPDSNKIAFVSERDGSRQPFVMNADGSGQQKLSERGTQHIIWLPNGLIAFDGDGGLYTVNPDGSDETLLVGGVVEYSAWSPNGNWIAYYGSCADFPTDCEVFIVDKSGQNKRTISTGNGMSPYYWPINWSPDSKRIAVQSFEENHEVFVIEIDSSSLRNVSNHIGDDLLTTWSPDGEWIAFISRDRNPPGTYIVRPDGTGLQLLITEYYISWTN